jgi:tRNA(Ile)-lysidine synthase
MPNARTWSVEAQLAACLARHRLLDGVRRLGIAVSGGSDSVALLRLLLPVCRARGITPVVLHLDHGLRGRASAADARFVERLAGRMGVEFAHGSAVDLPPSIVRRSPFAGSLEMHARELRQRFFRTVARKETLDAVATGHTADDVAETLLLRLARGGGATGLSGLRPDSRVAGVRYVRPLLDCAHASLQAWLRGQRQSWREDASNQDLRIPRNLLRHRVIPWLEANWTPSLRAGLARSAAILRDEDALLEETTARMAKRLQPAANTCRLPSTAAPALQRRLLRRWLLSHAGAAAAGWEEVETIRSLLGQGKPWQVTLPGGVRVCGCRNSLSLADEGRGRPPRAAAGGRLPVPGAVTVAGVRVTAREVRGIVRTAGPVGSIPSACSLDAAALRGKTLAVRVRRAGDRIRPLGLEGSKSLQDLLVDAKVPVAQRARLPLLTVDDEVVWVPGYRVAATYAVAGPRAKSVKVEMHTAQAANRMASRRHEVMKSVTS